MIDAKRRLPALTDSHFKRELEDQLQRMATEINRRRAGTTAERPPADQVPAGETYFDMTLGYRVDSDGTDWVDGTGTAV